MPDTPEQQLEQVREVLTKKNTPSSRRVYLIRRILGLPTQTRPRTYTCAGLTKDVKAYQRQRYDARRAAGLCPACPNVNDTPEKSNCSACRAKKAQRAREQHGKWNLKIDR